MDQDSSIGTRVAAIAAGGFAAMVAALWLWWPAGVALGAVFGVVTMIVIGRSSSASAEAQPHDGELDLTTEGDDDLWQDFRRLRVRLGDDWQDFSRAALIVTGAQSASAAALQRELGVSGAASARLIGLLEREGFVGPAAGTRPRTVLVDRTSAPELRRLLHV